MLARDWRKLFPEEKIFNPFGAVESSVLITVGSARGLERHIRSAPKGLNNKLNCQMKTLMTNDEQT